MNQASFIDVQLKPLLGLSDFDLQAHNEAQMFVNWCKTGQQKSVGMSETLNTSHSHPTTHSHTKPNGGEQRWPAVLVILCEVKMLA